MTRFGGRLAALASCVVPGERFADVGSDHAHLPLFLLRRGIARYAILTDVNKGPLARARMNILRAYAGDAGSVNPPVEAGGGGSIVTPDGIYDLRFGNGLEPLAHGEAATVIVAGMGGGTIIRILSADAEKTRSMGKYVLQPRTKAGMLREYIYSNGYYVMDEDLAEENGRICEILVVSSGAVERTEGAGTRAVPAEAEQLRMLKAKRHPLLGRYIEEKVRRECRIAGAAASAGANAEAVRRAHAARRRAAMLMEILND
jgi:tRNA (adenine22-N1)-methyltransferase